MDMSEVITDEVDGINDDFYMYCKTREIWRVPKPRPGDSPAEQAKRAETTRKIDPVDPKIVAGIRTMRMMAACNTSADSVDGDICAGFRDGIGMTLPRGDGCVLPILVSNEVAAQRRVIKGIGDQGPPPLNDETKAAAKVLQNCRLFKEYKRDKDPLLEAQAGMFLVPKDDDSYRLILDGRVANSRIDMTGRGFTLPSLETVTQTVDNASAEGKPFYVINVDIRHQFHQIPFPPHLQNAFCVAAWVVLMSIAWPMGFVLSPFVAMCVTSVLIFGFGEADQAWHFDFDLDPRCFDTDPRTARPQGWYPFKRGGGIFIYLDNILIITSIKAVIEKWRSHLKNQSERFNVVMKMKNPVTKEDLDPKEFWRKFAVTEMTKGSDKSFTFIGVEYRYNEHRAKQTQDDDAAVWSKAVERDEATGAHRWIGSRRVMAAVLGKLLWFLRVQGKKLHAFDATDEVRVRLAALYVRVSPGSDEFWAEPMPGVTQAEVDALGAAWSERALGLWTQARPMQQQFADDEITCIATDAASKGFVTAGVFLGAGADARPMVGTYDADQPIAIGELTAFVQMVTRVLTERRDTKLIVAVIDNLTAKSWIETGTTRNAAAAKLLRELYRALEGARCRVYVGYVPSADNFADMPSRGVDADSAEHEVEADHRRAASEKLVLRLKAQALGVWSVAGGRGGGSNNIRQREEEQPQPEKKYF